MQLLEIYNEAIRDLLVPDDQARQQRSLTIKNLERSGFNVPDAIQVRAGAAGLLECSSGLLHPVASQRQPCLPTCFELC